MLKLAVLISGGGSNLQALIDACAAPDFPGKIVLVISNKPEAYGLQRAAAANILTSVVDHRDFAERKAFEVEMDRQLHELDVGLICLAGFMRVLTPWFVKRWQGRLINIHPSLLPAYPGVDIHKRVLAAGEKQSGCTVHYVVDDVDAGPIIIQQSVPVLPGDDESKLAARVLVVEHQIYPQAVRMIAEGKAWFI